MGMLYGLVARDHVVLAEFSASPTNASSIARQILEKVKQGNTESSGSYSHDQFLFHVKKTDGLTVLCVADVASGSRIPFAFLEDIHQRFVKTYGRAISSAPAYAMNDEFSRVLSQLMDLYSKDANSERLNRLKDEMRQVHTFMIENIEKVLDRGDRLALLVEKTTALQGNTFTFKRQSCRYKSTIWWKNAKLRGAILLVLSIIVYIILAFVCRSPLLASCIKVDTSTFQLGNFVRQLQQHTIHS